MSTFGKKLREAREAKALSQSEVAKLLSTNHSIIGKYERDEVKPTIDVVKRLADVLHTTIGFLLGETKESSTLKDPQMLRRPNDLEALPEADKGHFLYTLDNLLASAKTRAAINECQTRVHPNRAEH